jgi:hypothetical protein
MESQDLATLETRVRILLNEADVFHLAIEQEFRSFRRSKNIALLTAHVNSDQEKEGMVLFRVTIMGNAHLQVGMMHVRLRFSEKPRG